ncbi:MAG: sn-glycerol-1-phosphate dehydrogenase [Kiritimatiellaeota bacterium]|nr:sn-glycerol-1-phosphate dehydrogenase [Kiritimatiellota bacterium]
MTADPFSLLGTTFTCPACGRTHTVNLRKFFLAAESETVRRGLIEFCAEFVGNARTTVVADARTWAAAGQGLSETLAAAGFEVLRLMVPDPAPDTSPVCDDRTRASLEPVVPECDLFVAVGSGVVSDLTKWIAADHGKPYVVFATAASMNGFASANVAPTIKGVKSLVHGTGPVAVVSSLEVLAAAPARMTEAGLGDVLAKGVSSLDWRLNHLVFGEYYCRYCVDLIKDIEPRYFQDPEGVADRVPGALSGLFEALVLTGIAMTVAGTSSPASGGEHLISHTLDMMSTLDGVPHDLHGRQVGVGTILAAALYDEILAMEAPRFRVLEEDTDPAFWGKLAGAVEEKHRLKREKAAGAVAALKSDSTLWDKLREELGREARGARVFKDCLRRAGAAHRIADLGMDRERFLAALLHAHQMRERYSILDLARAVGVLPERAREFVDRWIQD